MVFKRFPIYLAGITVASVIAAEIVLRFAVGLGDPPLARLDPDTEYELVPSGTYRRWGNDVKINAQGLRYDEIDLAASGRDDVRLLIVGDSVVYGNHFLDQEETIAYRTRDALNELDRFSTCDAHPLPVAASSWGPANQNAFIQRNGAFGAHAAVIIVSAHDLYDTPTSVSDLLPYRLRSPSTAIEDLLIALKKRWRKPIHVETLSARKRKEISLAALEAMVLRLREGGVDPILIYHPTLVERAGTLFQEEAAFKEWARVHNVRFHDLGESVRGADLYRDNIHPNAKGARLIARALALTIAPDLPGCD